VPLPRGTYDIDLRIGVPRAQLVDWKVTCTDREQHGTVGQAFDDYRDRRLAQLTTEREQQAKIQGRAPAQPRPMGAVIVARAAGARVVTPVGRVIVRPAPVVVRSEATTRPVPVELEELEIPPVTELPPGDLGQGVYPANVRVTTASDGVCAITAVSDDPNVSAFFSITRVRDLGAEEADRKQQIYVGAVTARGRVTQRLLADGADLHAKQRRLAAVEARQLAERQVRVDAETTLRAEAEARRGVELVAERERENKGDVERRQRLALEDEQRRLRLEGEAKLKWDREAPARARAELVIRQTEISIRWRLTLIAWLARECQADPDRRGRIARERAQRERERQARLEIRLEIERTERERVLRIRLEQGERQAELDRVNHAEREAVRENRDAIERARREREARAIAELELRRTADALRMRQTIIGSLISYGARLRPPMPALQLENPGPTPFDGAGWAAGRWEWISIRGEWQWRGGGWRDSTRFGHTGGETIVRREPEPAVPTTILLAPPPVTTVTTVVSTPTVVTPMTPGVIIEINHSPARPRPTYRPRRDNYQPAPRTNPRPTSTPRDPKRDRRKDDDKRRQRL